MTLSKFGILFSLTGGENKVFGFLVREQKRGNFLRKGGRITLE